MNTLERILVALGIGATVAAGAGCDDGNGEEDDPPVAQLTVSPAEAEKVNDTVILNASASASGTGSITGYTFDFGDGSPVYTETPGSALDGLFDGKTTHDYLNEGDHPATVLVSNSSGLSDSASASAKVGFGDDVSGAVSYVSSQINTDYTQTYNQAVQLFDPVEAKMVAFVADIKGESASFGDIYIFYDWDRLTSEQQACLANRESQGLYDPTVILVEDDDSPNTIDNLLDGHGALKALGAKSASPETKAYAPVEPAEELEVF